MVAEAGDAARTIGLWLGGLAVLVLATALVLGWTPLVPTSLLMLGAAYGVHLSADDVRLDSTAPVLAAVLLVAAELAFWSLEERECVRAEPGDGLRRLGFLLLLGLGALAVALGLLATADLARTGGLGVDLLGAAAAASALSAVLLLARRHPS